MLGYGDLDELYGFQLKMLLLACDTAARSALEPFGMTPARLAALKLVEANPGCSQSAVGEALSINRSSAMKLLHLLEARGLILREPGTDLRSNALRLTDQGHEAVAAMMSALRACEEQVFAAARKSDLAALNRLCTSVRGQSFASVSRAAE